MHLNKEKWEWLWDRKQYTLHYNGSCVKCDAIEKFMIRIGAVVFCAKCVREEFNSNDPIREERERYHHWQAESNRKLDLTWDEEQCKFIEDDEKEYKISICHCDACEKVRSK
jgi:hypothetical protein